MGKKLDALLGRGFKTSKFKTLVSLAVSRLAVLKNQRQVRCSQARSDVSKLLQLGQHERALLRVEHVIQEQNMLEAFVIIEGYCHVLMERVALIENSKECPDELKEAISSLIYATSRCGQFPELQEIRSVLTSWYGKEVAARAAELRSNCGVKTGMIQKLSTRQPSMESRTKVLREIASENGVTLQLDQDQSTTLKKEEKWASNKKQSKPEQNLMGNLDDDNSELKEKARSPTEEIKREEQFSGSLRSRKKYADVATAAQAAFESAAYAAAAARAAVELSRSESQGSLLSPSSELRNKSADERSSASRLGTQSLSFASESESEEEELIREEKSKEGLVIRSLSASSSNSEGELQLEIRKGSNEQRGTERLEKIVFYESDEETQTQSENGGLPWPRQQHVLGSDDVKSRQAAHEFTKIKQTKVATDTEDEGPPQRLNIERRRPISVRTRHRR